MFVDDNDDQTVYVADCAYHRIVKWEADATSGSAVAGGNGKGARNDQLSNPVNMIVG